MAKEKEFLNFMFTKHSDLGFVHAKQSAKVDAMIQWLQSKKQWADENNNGFIAWDVLTTKADEKKLYSVWNDYVKPDAQKSSEDHMPDRDSGSDLPF
jgi:hypothetical protein|tara:strand:- start:536 stop:826 length:291 start_codon:yes stop_codon:yes gene_type:complete